MEHKDKASVPRPSVVLDDHLSYLDDLRESGETNMFGARPYLMREFPELSKEDALIVVGYWMSSFEERHPQSS